MKNRRYGLIEIKLGGEENIEKSAYYLKRLKNKIDDDKMNKFSFKMVIVGVGTFAYKRKDDVLVVPITALKN